MLAFTGCAPLSLRWREASPACCPTRRTPCAVLESPSPKSLDEVVRGWFSSSRVGRSSAGVKPESNEEMLSSEISGPQAASDTEAHYLLSTTIVARKESAAAMSALLQELSDAAAAAGPDEGLLNCAVNQSPDDPACFLLFERFKGPASMTKHQKGEVYQNFIRSAQPLLEKPFGMHICKEIGGKISLAYHPFGPAGRSRACARHSFFERKGLSFRKAFVSFRRPLTRRMCLFIYLCLPYPCARLLR